MRLGPAVTCCSVSLVLSSLICDQTSRVYILSDQRSVAVQGVWAASSDSIHQCVRELGPAPGQDPPDGCQPCYLANLASWPSGNTEEVKYQ